MAPPNANQDAPKGPQGIENGPRPPLHAPRLPDPEQLPHQKTQVEPADMDQQTFEYVLMPAQMSSSQPSRVVDMGEGPLDHLPSLAHQPLSPSSADPALVRVDRPLLLALLSPAPPALFALRNVRPDLHLLEAEQRPTIRFRFFNVTR